MRDSASRTLGPDGYDVFLSHASEDKAAFVEPLYLELTHRRLSVWYDRVEIKLGDDLRRRMEEGLMKSRFGVVILSPNFLKYWPQRELSVLQNFESTDDTKRILPVVLGMEKDEFVQRFPSMATRLCVMATEGIDAVATKIIEVAGGQPTADGEGGAGWTTSWHRPALGRTRIYGSRRRRSMAFVGREAVLEQLEDLLLRRGENAGICASIAGLAGVGKTELALHLVDRLALAGAFAGGIYWLDAEDTDLTLQWGGRIADQWGTTSTGVSQSERAALTILEVEKVSGSVLVVLDNVTEWTESRHPQPLPDGAHVRLLVTTRQKSLGGTAFTPVELKVLDVTAAHGLLEAVANRGSIADADALLEHLEGHALALELAGAYLGKYKQESPATYLAKLLAGEAAPRGECRQGGSAIREDRRCRPDYHLGRARCVDQDRVAGGLMLRRCARDGRVG